MASYYEQVQEAIENNEKELAHLQDELKGLRTVEKDTPPESYQRQHAQILYHINQEQKKLEKNQALKRDYNETRSAIVELREAMEQDGLDELRTMLVSERDPQIRREILEELEAKEKEYAARVEKLETRVQKGMSELTDELAEELRQSFQNPQNENAKDEPIDEVPIVEPTDKDEEVLVGKNEEEREIEIDSDIDNPQATDERKLKLQTDLDAAEEEVIQAQKVLQESIARFQDIFAEERMRIENEGPFRTEAELNDFESEYMRQKIEENERFAAAQIAVRNAETKVQRITRKLEEHMQMQEEARSLGVEVDVYEKIKDAVTQPDVMEAIYEQNGLGKVYRKTEAENTQYEAVTAEAIANIVEQLKASGIVSDKVTVTQGDVTQSGTVNINQNGGININIIYGGNTPVQAGESRKTTLTPEEINTIETTQKDRVPDKRIPHNGDEQKGKVPGKAPSDMIVEDKTGEKEPTIKVEELNIPPVLYGPRPPEQIIDIPGKTPQKPEGKQDGEYQLKGDQIIQDGPIGNKEPQKPDPNKKGPTGLVPYDPNKKGPTGLVPYDPNKKGPTGLVPHDPNQKPPTTVVEPTEIQLLYGTPVVPPTKQKGEEPPKKKPSRGLMTILDELTDGLDLKAKDGKRYKASNIKVFKGFKEELSSGNFLYNIVHLVPAIVKLPFNLIRKVSGKIMTTARAKKNAATLKKRLDKMIEDWKQTGDDSDLMTIFTEYRGNKVLQERFPTILNTLLDETMQKYALGKVTQINSELEVRYQSAFVTIKQLDALKTKLDNPNISANDKQALEAEKARLLKGQAANIAAIRQGYKTANGWLSGGLHGFSEDMKAATTKLSVVGKRFAKDHDLDNDLLRRQAELERAEMQAIADGNDEMALRVFVENELLLSENTEIKGSVFGRRSTGKKYYSPLAEQLDYRDDPFVRDLFTTIAVTSATISTIQSISAARNQAAIIAENNRRMAQNNQTMQQVNQMGADIAGKRGDMMEGMQAQGMQDTLTAADEIERAVLDKTNWVRGTSTYSTLDKAGHTYYTSFYGSTKQAYEDIAQQYASGQINQAQAMQLMADLGDKTQQTFAQINDACLNILKPYAAAHPQYDLSAVQGAMEYLQSNPSAVSAMNQAMVDVTNAGDVLASMQLQQLIPLTTLPDSIRTVIINGAATAALASNINNSMGAKKHTYGNSVTAMVDEYEQQASQASTQEKSNGSSK